ncbi:MAG: MaoC family dehydratase N-terminal domain-containing protein [Candidatus Competibacter sp.]|nr:MaoC family dehydratase N-terminal domain-containing protein [Candidatus Competibacter sp.]MDG4582768.1 MaoC family dehydratase N-terminal domain-containing protein [Candidatus Competibacter sp.]
MSDANLQDWVGKKEEIRDCVYPTPARALALTLNDRDFVGKEGDPLPELWHWLYFLPLVARAEIGPDGHPKRGGFLPPVSLERRMWASGQLTFHQDLRIGEAVTKTSEILKVAEKEGKAGRMVFVTVRHLIGSVRGIAIEEQQDIVYLPMPKAFVAAAPNPVPGDLAWKEAYPVDPVLLFRFSALTFNSHKIHYDIKYATEVEKYPGLVVHGPLQAVLLLESAKRNNPDRRPASYRFRALRPLFDFDQVSVCGRPSPDGGHELYTANTGNDVGMQATVSWR